MAVSVSNVIMRQKYTIDDKTYSKTWDNGIYNDANNNQYCIALGTSYTNLLDGAPNNVSIEFKPVGQYTTITF